MARHPSLEPGVVLTSARGAIYAAVPSTPSSVRVETPSLTELRRRASYKWQAHPPGVLPSFVAEMDFLVADAIRDALAEAVALGDTGYAWPGERLRQAFAGFAERRYGWTVDERSVHVVADVMVGVLEVLRRVAFKGEGVVVNPPVYHPFFNHIEEAGCHVVEAPLARSPDGAYAMDFDALERAFSGDRVRVYLLCNPHNPTGLVLSEDDLRRILELAERHDIVVLADEIHAPLVLPGARHVPLLSLGQAAAARTIAFHSASKGWNIPGLKCAQVVAASGRMRSILDSFPEAVTFRVGHLGVIASTAAYEQAEPWLDEAVRIIDGNHHLFLELLGESLPAVKARRPQATYLAWLDCRALELGPDPAALFERRGGVALDSGPRFGSGGDGYARATIATSEELLRDIVARMQRALV